MDNAVKHGGSSDSEITGAESDLLCAPYYVGKADRHMPNHAGRMVSLTGGAFEVSRDCHDVESSNLDEIRSKEAALGITQQPPL